MKELFYDWGGLNAWLFHTINGVRGEWLDQFMLLGTQLGDHTSFSAVLCLLLLAALVVVPRSFAGLPGEAERITRLWLGVIAVFSTAYFLDGVVLSWLKPYLDFPRPAVVFGQSNIHVVGELKQRYSFPSGHSTFAMLVCASLWPLGRGWRLAGLFFLAWVGLSRISVGAHFPADVVGGFSLSLAIVLMVRWLVTGIGEWSAASRCDNNLLR